MNTILSKGMHSSDTHLHDENVLLCYWYIYICNFRVLSVFHIYKTYPQLNNSHDNTK